MVTYKIGGSEYPLALTLGAMEKIDELCGGFENASAAFEGKSIMETVDILVSILYILVAGGVGYARANGERVPDVPEPALIKAQLMPKDIRTAKERVFQAMAEGMGRTVDVEPDPKNAEATPSE